MSHYFIQPAALTTVDFGQAAVSCVFMSLNIFCEGVPILELASYFPFCVQTWRLIPLVAVDSYVTLSEILSVGEDINL